MGSEGFGWVPGLRISVVDPDPDYLGIEVLAASERFAGMTQIYAGIGELLGLAEKLKGFPARSEDLRVHELGSREGRGAGGFCGLTFRCRDRAGHVVVDVLMRDDAGRYPAGEAEFRFGAEAAAVDEFVEGLRRLERDAAGRAWLVGSW